jgi:two-component system chemotaxis response regulator CheB
MGEDGARGLTRLKEQGALTFAQDEASCAVFGMPKKAIEYGGACFVGNPNEIRQQLNAAILKHSEKEST